MIGADRSKEWLESDGLGGFASGTLEGIRTRRYHALLLAAAAPPARPFVLVNGVEAWLEGREGIRALTSQLYVPGVVHPDGVRRIISFEAEPWPVWRYRLEEGGGVTHAVFVPRGLPVVALSWRVEGAAREGVLCVRPLLSGRDPHALHHENPAFRFDTERTAAGGLRWRPYEGVPAVSAVSNGVYEHAPDWYRGFLYERERERGLDYVEDLASPGLFRWKLDAGEATLVLCAETPADTGRPVATANSADLLPSLSELRQREARRRAAFPSRLHRSADAYLVRRRAGLTVIAGYPWFGEWGRDTFIALRGLCLAGGRPEEAGRVLVEWSRVESSGMLPNRFPDRGEPPEYNSVDAALWFVVAVQECLEAMEVAGSQVDAAFEAALQSAVGRILDGYAGGTRHGIRMDSDGLLAAGAPGTQLTWMDAKVGDWVVTPRIGKPVEIQALWINALKAASRTDPRWRQLLVRAARSFAERFWNPGTNCLYDVVDVDHEPGRSDGSIRPNQLFAVGGLPWSLLDGPRARAIVDAAEEHLWTPLGPRSLAPGEPGYAPRYEGGPRDRDAAYHQGTVWPWLAGPFVEAWLRVRGGAETARAEARERFLAPLLSHLDEAGIGHVSEIADAEPPHTPRGCPFQAWSVGELLRLSRLLEEGPSPNGRRRRVGRPDAAGPRSLGPPEMRSRLRPAGPAL